MMDVVSEDEMTEYPNEVVIDIPEDDPWAPQVHEATEPASPVRIETWTDLHRDTLQLLADKCLTKAELHSDASVRTSRRGAALGYPLSVITGAMSPVSLILGDSSSAKYINAGAFFIVSGLSALMTIWDYKHTSRTHKLAHFEYYRLYNKICFQLSKDPIHRRDAAVFMYEIRKTYDSIVKMSPILE